MKEKKDSQDKINKVEKNNKKKFSKKKILVIIASIIFSIISIGLIIWVFLLKQPSFTGENTSFEISAPSEIVAGDTATYQIDLINNENVDLENIEISIIYPNSFVFKSADPKSLSFNDNRWIFDNLGAGEKKSIKIKGDLYGEVGSTLVCVANITYKPRNVSSNFNQTSEASTKINSSDIDIEVNIPNTAQVDKEFEYIIKATNPTDFDISNIRIESILPENFELVSSEPNYKSSYYWDFPKIIAGETHEIKLNGKITGQIGDASDVKIRFGLFDGHDNFYLQGEDIYSIKLVDVSGDLKLLVNGVEGNAKNPGDLLEYTLFYRNTGSEILKDNIFTLKFDNKKLLDENSIITDDQGEYSNGVITWSSQKIEKIKNIEPNQEGAFVFKIKIISPIIVDSIEDSNFSIKAKSKHIAKRGESKEEVTIEGNGIETKINSEVILTSEARYYDYQGKQVGSGPLPPKVGEKTTYRIYLTLANRTNDVDNGRIEILLSERAKWEMKKIVSVGDLKFEGDIIIWEIGKIPANTGQFANSMTAEFEVSIEPEQEDVGKVIGIIKEMKLMGLDSFTSNKVEIIQEGLNTTLTKDFLSQGKDEVSN